MSISNEIPTKKVYPESIVHARYELLATWHCLYATGPLYET